MSRGVAHFTPSFPVDVGDQPTLANGHIGFTVFSDTVYMNDLYNGHAGLSHRARIPNWANVRIQPLVGERHNDVSYRMNVRDGTFEAIWSVDGDAFQIVQRLYAHRYHTRAIVNEVHILRGSRFGKPNMRSTRATKLRK